MNIPGALLAAGLAVMSALAFALYGVDKTRARHGAWRVSERALLLCALCLGAFGAAAGMAVFHHKTRKLKFRLLVPALCILQALALLAAWGVI